MRGEEVKAHRGAGWTLIEADCLEAMAKLPENSMDSVVSDPPYGLSEEPPMLDVLAAWLIGQPYVPRGRGFMGKQWDAFIPGPEVWRECYRVLKPGGHLLAFGGSRTFDLVALAIRLAGFEIRDTLSWLYGVGFPKSLNVSKAMEEKELLCECSAPTQRDVRSLQDANVSPPVDTSEEPGQVLLTGMSEPRASASGRAQSASDVRPAEPRVEGRGDATVGERQLQGRGLCSVPPGFAPDGTGGRVRHGAPTRDGREVEAVPHADGSRPPSRPRPAQQRSSEPGALPGQRHAQTCGGCGKTRREFVGGMGTALKPAWEPIILARKPLSGTVAANILAHGTGALNIDGCRIDGDPRPLREVVDNGTMRIVYGGNGGSRAAGERANLTGRWPANVILDEQAAQLLDEQAGTRTSGSMAAGVNAGRKSTVYAPDAGRPLANEIAASTGGASRFFYVAKASRSERDEGCDALPMRSGGEATDRENDSAGTNSPRAGAGRTGGARNIHPTVKPIALMRHLVRLVTPPGGYVFDPFAGSGSTGVAALQEGFRFGGCERESEYAQIAVHRLTHATRKRASRPPPVSPEPLSDFARRVDAQVAGWEKRRLTDKQVAEATKGIRPPAPDDEADLERWDRERGAALYAAGLADISDILTDETRK